MLLKNGMDRQTAPQAGGMRVKSASSRLGAALLLCLGLTLLVIAAIAVLGGGHPPAVEYKSRGDALAVLQPPVPRGEIPVNTADVEALTLLPGIGASTAAEIIREREANGPFHFPEDLMAVKGIGKKKLEGMLPHIRLDEHP